MPCGTPTLTRYSCENFPTKTAQSRLLLKKDKIRPNTGPEIPWDLILWRRTAYHTRVVPDISKTLVILSDTIVRRSAVDWEDLKPYFKLEKKSTFFVAINKPIIYKFSKVLLTIVMRLTERQILGGDFFPTFLNTGTTEENFQESKKQDSLKHILKSLTRYVWKFRLKVLQNHYLNTIRTRYL